MSLREVYWVTSRLFSGHRVSQYRVIWPPPWVLMSPLIAAWLTWYLSNFILAQATTLKHFQLTCAVALISSASQVVSTIATVTLTQPVGYTKSLAITCGA